MKNLMELGAVLDKDMAEFWSGPQAIPATAMGRDMLRRFERLPAVQQEALVAILASLDGETLKRLPPPEKKHDS